MARVTSEKVGRGLCPSKGCNDLVMYRKSSGGMLTCKCDGCDSSSYAIPGSQAFQQRMQSIEALAPKPASDPAPAIPSAPESHPNGPHSVAKTRPAFSLQNL